MKIIRFTAGLVASALLLAGCGAVEDSGAGPGSKHLDLVTVYPANSTDAHVNHTSFILNSGTTETLVGLDPETNELYGWLATDWSSEDSIHWTFAIREGVSFHDGTPMDAEAVRTSLQHSIDVNPGMAAALKIAEMQAEGHTLKITTSEPYASLPSQLVHYNTVITNVAASTEYPIGTGAFRFTSFNTTGAAELERFEDYWDGKAKLDSVTMTANEDANTRLLSLQSGQADVIYRPSLESLDALEKDSDFTVDAVPGARVYHLIYNYRGANSDLFNNIEFRRGINALVDREAIAGTILHGNAAVTDNPMPGGSPLSPPLEDISFSTDKALEHFRKAGLDVTDGRVTRNGAPVTLKVGTYVARPELPQIAQAVQANAAKLGIEMTIDTADNIDEYLLAGDWDLATYSLATLTRGDGSYFVNGAFLPDGAQNFGGLDDPTLISMIDTFNATVDTQSRAGQIRDIAVYVRDQSYNSYIVSPFETSAYKKTVSGWITPSNEFEFQMITRDLDIEQ
ncbi:ABC transporter substrate-binding protein [Corynebacterium pacaense]|uniref:ABC transporter substrate-binding protein n=1 Tax=Corynebacterium pacaense TaxID=1816684 RepID=UPI0009BBCD02|nr:ABC transporter substrate-binding protein [Corynebacterium pacaense]